MKDGLRCTKTTEEEQSTNSSNMDVFLTNPTETNNKHWEKNDAMDDTP
jgi:hypothetical protein